MASSVKVSDFRESYQSCGYKNQTVFSVRSLSINNSAVLLVVNPQTLESNLIKESCLRSCIDLSDREVSRTNYGSLLDDVADGRYVLQNDGVTVGRSDKYVALTIDMCPSTKGISQKVYDGLVKLSEQQGKAIPIGVAMTAGWQKRHRERFKWIKSQALSNKLSVEWINHSYHHTYKRGVSLRRNFMLSSGTNVEKEVLGNERSMIEGGVTPSVFFRFPGLVSSGALMEQVVDWGLVPIGSEAWLGKGERAEEGDIILIHGNRNEPKGETAFFKYLRGMAREGHEFGRLYDVLFN